MRLQRKDYCEMKPKNAFAGMLLVLLALSTSFQAIAADTIPPVIKLSGGTRITLSVFSTYTDAGATALDNIDGDLTSKIVTENLVNPTVLGTYLVTYNVRDAAGNAALQKVRTVKVIDRTKPVVKITGGSSVTLQVLSAYTELGATATDNYNGDLTAQIVIAGSVNTSIPGIYYITYTVKDSSGNTTIAKRTVKVVDSIHPVVTLNGSSYVTVPVFNTYTELGATASDNFDGDLTAQIVRAGTVNPNVVGTYYVTYTAKDSSNNATTAKRTVKVVDKVKPVITLLGTSPCLMNVGGTYVDAGATALDNYNGDITAKIVTTSTVNTAVAGSYSVKYSVRDTSNNTATTVTRSVKVYATGAILAISPAALVFDTQPISDGATAPLTLTVRNVGNGPLQLTALGLKLSGTNPNDFAVVSNGIPAAGLAPGATASILATFDPAAVGVRSAILTINSNAKNSTAYPITLAGTGTTFPIHAEFEADKVRAVAGDTVSFTDTSEYGAEVITSYTWDFGDGTTGTGATVTHVYNVAGAYTVKLTIATAFDSDTVEKTNLIDVYASTPLDEYVRTPLPDPAFNYTLKNTLQYPNSAVYIFQMTSQNWRTAAEVNLPVWKHWLSIIRPTTVTNSRTLMVVSGGGNTNGMPTNISAVYRDFAAETGSVVAVLTQVPSEPLVFPNDPLGYANRTEDEIISYSLWQYLQTGDNAWPAFFPMAKSVVRAMDLVQAFMPTAPSPATIKDFVVTGASKRGWTTWMTACTDGRVAAIAPIVIDILNTNVQMDHHRGIYGGYSEEVHDYTDFNLFWEFHTPEASDLLSYIDPFSYRERLTMPKMIFSATGDQFFCPDSSQFYFSQLRGENALCIVPNVDHSMGGYETVIAKLTPWYVSLLPNQTPCPKLTWTASDTEITVTTDNAPSHVLLWTGTSPDRDFRLWYSTASAWTSSELTPISPNHYRAAPAAHVSSWKGFYIQVTFDKVIAGVSLPYVFSTELRVIPPATPVPPTANLLGVPPIPVAGHKILFSDRSVVGSQPIVSWQWDLGDGTTFNTQSVQDFEHTYAAAGIYPVSLTVSSQTGTSSKTLNVVVP